MKVSIFGGSGFVGDYIINELISSKYNVYALVRLGNKHKIRNSNKIKIIITYIFFLKLNKFTSL